MKKLLMILPLALILCFTFSCQDKEAMAELEAMKAQAEVEEQNKALVNRMYEALSTGDFEAYKELLAPDYACYYPSRSARPISREEMIGIVKEQRKAFPDLAFSIEELIAVEDRVIVRIILRGTHEGGYRGIPATGNKFVGSGIIIGRIENGKFVEERGEFGMLGMLMQLGMELKPKEAEK
jgi:steroid delta-isomerase-like uncharacterized protein